MPLEGAISTEHIKGKLRELKKYLPDAPDVILEFAKYFADQINPELFPIGYALSYDYSTLSLEQGIHGDGTRIHHELARMPHENYVLIRDYFSKIADIVCPTEFGSEAKELFEEGRKKLGS